MNRHSLAGRAGRCALAWLLAAPLLCWGKSALADWAGPQDRYQPTRAFFEATAEGGVGLFDPTATGKLTFDPVVGAHLGVRLRELDPVTLRAFAQFLGTSWTMGVFNNHLGMSINFAGRAIWGMPSWEKFVEFGIGAGFDYNDTQGVYGVHSNFQVGGGFMFPLARHFRLCTNVLEISMYNAENGNPVFSFRTTLGVDLLL
jgi:hypothetical protein